LRCTAVQYASTAATMLKSLVLNPGGNHATGISKKVADRLTAGIMRFQPIVAAAKMCDKPESDNVTIVTYMLDEVFGYAKYSAITSEFAIKSTFLNQGPRLHSAAPQSHFQICGCPILPLPTS
jgi:hypothetical protein